MDCMSKASMSHILKSDVWFKPLLKTSNLRAISFGSIFRRLILAPKLGEQVSFVFDFDYSLSDHQPADHMHALAGDHLEIRIEHASTASKPMVKFLRSSAVPRCSSILQFTGACVP
jgi:hypothetical protein